MAQIRIPVRIPVPIGDMLAGAATAQFDAAWNAGAIQKAVRAVLERTVLREYRRLVLAALPTLLDPVLESGSMRRPEGFRPEEQRELLRLMERRDDLRRARGSAEDMQAVNKKIGSYVFTLGRRLDLRGTARTLATKKFRKEVMRMLDYLTNADNVEVWRVAGVAATQDRAAVPERIAFGIGRISALDRILTPSYASSPLVKRKRTYRRATLWRHVEFGTGLFTTDKSRRQAPWQFGRLGVVGASGVGGFPKLRAQLQRLDPELKQTILQAVFSG